MISQRQEGDIVRECQALGMSGNVLPDSGDHLAQLAGAEGRDAGAKSFEGEGLLVRVLCLDDPIGIEDKEVTRLETYKLGVVSGVLLEADNGSWLGAHKLCGTISGKK